MRVTLAGMKRFLELFVKMIRGICDVVKNLEITWHREFRMSFSPFV